MHCCIATDTWFNRVRAAVTVGLSRSVRTSALAAVALGLGLSFAAAQSEAQTADASAKSLLEGVEDSRIRQADSDVEIIEHEGKPALNITVGHKGGDYPGAEVSAPSGTWDLKDYTAVKLKVTNTGDKGVRVHGRVDNEGDWRKQPWSINATNIKPGQTGTVTVPFGRSYGNDGFDLDPGKIIRFVVFAEKPKGQTTLRLEEVTAVKGGGGSSAQTSGGGATFTPPGSNTLFDFANKTYDESQFSSNGAAYEIVDTDDGKALQMSFNRGERWPGVHLTGPNGGGWDMSNFAGVEAIITNPTDKAINAALRVDNPGGNVGGREPWNAEKIRIRPGQTETVRVKFGQSWGSPGYDLNPAGVIRVLVYAEGPPADTRLLVNKVATYGQPMARGADTVDLKGVLFDFGPSFVMGGRVDERGGKASHQDGKLVLSFNETEEYPGVALSPVGTSWDLSKFGSVQAEVTNTGENPARIGLRVDNPGGPKASNTELINLAPGESKTLKVTFGKSHGNAGYELNPAEVTSLLFMVEKPKGAVMIAVDEVKANRLAYATVPDWIGQRPPVEGDWVKTLDENFDSGSLDKDVWTPRLVWDGPAGAELQRYLEQNVIVEDGKMKLKAEVNPGHQYDNPELDTRKYATAAVTTLDKWTQQYGYFEARIKAPTARGLWPAFWLMPDRGEKAGNIWVRRSTENGGMEIDIWEHLTEWGPGRYNIAAHWDGYGKDHKQWGNSHIYHLPTEDGWHNYGLLWEPDKLTFFCDGRKVGEWADERILDMPAYIKFTIQMGNWATKDVDDAALPDYLQVEYVRVWQLAERAE